MKVEQSFEYFSQLLKDHENNIFIIIKDKFDKLAHNQDYNQKVKFLTGVEGLDFSKS